MSSVEVGKLLGVSCKTIIRWCKWSGNPMPHEYGKCLNDKPSSNRMRYVISATQLRQWLHRCQAARQACDPIKLKEFMDG